MTSPSKGTKSAITIPVTSRGRLATRQLAGHITSRPARYRNSDCGPVTPDGDQGGFKLWQTNGVTIKHNYIHNNWGPGIWADTNNANTTIVGNTLTHNDGEAVIEEISYNFSITGNYLAYNGWAAGLGNPRFPTAAIYVSESGSSTTFGGVPACREPSCSAQRSYPSRSVIGGNVFLLDNSGGGIFLRQNSDRHCSSGLDSVCTLLASAGPTSFTLAGCHANIPSASLDTATYVGRDSGSPRQDWWDGCLWKTENVSVTNNIIDFNPATLPTAIATPGRIVARTEFSANTARPLHTPRLEAGSSPLSSRSSRTIPGRTTSTMAL